MKEGYKKVWELLHIRKTQLRYSTNGKMSKIGKTMVNIFKIQKAHVILQLKYWYKIKVDDSENQND